MEMNVEIDLRCKGRPIKPSDMVAGPVLLEADLAQSLIVNEFSGGFSDESLAKLSVQELAQMLRALSYLRDVVEVVGAAEDLGQATVVVWHHSDKPRRLSDHVQLTHRIAAELVGALADVPRRDWGIGPFLKQFRNLPGNDRIGRSM